MTSRCAAFWLAAICLTAGCGGGSTSPTAASAACAGTTAHADVSNGGSGTVTVTQLKTVSVAGTFSFTTVPSGGTLATANKTLASGAFNITF